MVTVLHLRVSERLNPCRERSIQKKDLGWWGQMLHRNLLKTNLLIRKKDTHEVGLVKTRSYRLQG